MEPGSDTPLNGELDLLSYSALVAMESLGDRTGPHTWQASSELTELSLEHDSYMQRSGGSVCMDK